MNNSIESMWKKGFLASDNLIAPKVNDLYNRKSIHIIARFKRMFKTNLILIVVGASVFLIAGFLIKAPVYGVLIFLLLLLQVVLGYKSMQKLDSLDQTQSSYQYLKEFQSWIKNTMKDYVHLNRLSYPSFFACFFLGMWNSVNMEDVKEHLMSDPDQLSVFGLPLWIALPGLIILILITIFSKPIYELDIKTIYGGIMTKLDEMVADMEELRKTNDISDNPS